MSKNKSYTLKELSTLVQADFIGNPDQTIKGVNTLEDANEKDISFLANPLYEKLAEKSKAGAICISEKGPFLKNKNYLISKNPSSTFQSIAKIFLDIDTLSGFSGIHLTAIIHPSAKIGKKAIIGPYAVIDKEVKIGDETFIGPFVYVGAGSRIGKMCILYSSCVVRERCTIGNGVILQPGAIIGSCGFGYTRDKDGKHQKLEQIGSVEIEDEVEIGANTTVDRARLKKTKIRKGSKIDNLVQIAHNVEVGEDNVIAAQTGIAGSSKTGKGVMLGGQVGIIGHVTLDDNVMVATRGGVSKNLKSGKYRGSPAIKIERYHRQQVFVRQLEKYIEEIKILKEKIRRLEEK